MSGSADILDGFFVGPEISSQGGGGSALWGSEQHQQHPDLRRQRQQLSNALQPHTPDNSVDVATTTSICSSTPNNGDKDISGLPGSRGEVDYKEAGGVAVVNLGMNGGVDRTGGVNQNSSSDVSNGNNNVNYVRVGVEPSISPVPSGTASNEAFAPLGSRYIPDVGQRLPHQVLHHQQPNIPVQLGPASLPKVDRVNEAGVPSTPALPRGDGMLDQLLSRLGESKIMATLLLMQTMHSSPQGSPAVAILDRVVATLEESITNITQSRDLLSPPTTNGGVPFHGMPNDVLLDPLHAPPLQAQPQHQQFQPNGGDMPYFPGPSAPGRYNDRAIWFPPQMPGSNGDGGNLMETGCPTVTVGAMHQPHASPSQKQQNQKNQRRHRQQPHAPAVQGQRPFDSGMLPSNQMAPYINGGGPAAGAAYNNSNAPLLDMGDDSLPAYDTSADSGAALVDGSRGNHTGSSNNGVGGGVLGQGGDEIIRGPPHRPSELQLPPGSEEVESFLAFVEFKRGRVRKYECRIDIFPGQYVIVDGDRGRDCGLVVQTVKCKPDGNAAVCCMDGCNVNSDKIKLEKGRVLGVATTEEIDYIHHTMQRAERIALETCRKVCDDMGIRINLLDCEYQFDMEKVSFYFNSEHSVDFRPLVRELYRTFRVRIWMENTNPRVKNSMPTGGSGGVRRGSIKNSNNNNGDDSDGIGDDVSVLSDVADAVKRHEGGNGASGPNGGGKRRGCQRGFQRQKQAKRSSS